MMRRKELEEGVGEWRIGRMEEVQMRRVDCSLQWLPQYCYNILPYTCNQVAFPLSYQSDIGLILIGQLDRVGSPVCNSSSPS